MSDEATAAVTPTPRRPGRPRNADRIPQHVAAAPEHAPDHDAAHAEPRLRTRQRNATVNDDPFYIPLNEIPEGSSYEWKRYSNVGEENPFYIAQMRSQGWEPVDPKRHPNWVPPGYDKPNIIKSGMLLMERPIELTREAQSEQRGLAKQQMREAEQRLGMTPKDTLTRQHPGVEPRLTKEYVRPVAIQED